MRFEEAPSFGHRVQTVDISEFSSSVGAAQVSVTVFTKAAKKAGAEGAGCGIGPGDPRNETAQSVMGMSANCRADQFSVRDLY